jgi:hypothetical protein
MKKLLSLACGLALLPLAARSADDPFAGWSEAQLKVKITQLSKENKELKEKLAAGAGSGSAAAAAPAAKATADLLVDDFEAPTAKNGQGWWNGCDDNKLGTTLEPQPYAPAPGGHSGSCNRIHGHMGANKAPWPWAQTGLKLTDPNLSGYSGVSFWAKGDGLVHRISLQRTAVKDFAHFYAEFTAPKAWTKVTIPFTQFAQPADWGEKIPMAWTDVETIQFLPGTNDADYDFSVDDLVLTK